MDDLEQLELLSRIDDLVDSLKAWADDDVPWAPLARSKALVRRVLDRVDALRIRLEAPLVVATFGGTGTGKSTLVNALVGRECSTAGRQRPTTTRPVLIAHPELELERLGLPLEELKVVQVDSAVLKDIVVVDCPDPDTTESETAGSNLARLHRLLPQCDVLIYTSTQQKYRSARVTDELQQAAAGCRLLFVQTHAGLDEDVREDWRSQLDGRYAVPDMFFVDSVRALEEQQSGRRPSGEFGRLVNTLTTHLAASQRVKIRRANLLDLLHAALSRCCEQLAADWPQVERLKAALDEQRNKLTGAMSRQLTEELSTSRNLWERRLLSAVTDNWGFSPFSAMLRLYNGLGGLIASMSFFRARNTAQMALIGAMQGARWIRSRVKEMGSESNLERVAAFGLSDDVLQEAQFVIAGYAKSARIDAKLADLGSLDHLRSEAARMEDQFLGDAGRRVDGIIEDLAGRNSGFFIRGWYELLFLAYLGFVLFWVGRNFFYESFFQGKDLLTLDFYVPAGVFFLLWSAVLVMGFTGRLRRGLKRRISDLAGELTQHRFARGLFPDLEQACKNAAAARTRLESLSEQTAELRDTLADTSALGAATSPHMR